MFARDGVFADGGEVRYGADLGGGVCRAHARCLRRSSDTCAEGGGRVQREGGPGDVSGRVTLQAGMET